MKRVLCSLWMMSSLPTMGVVVALEAILTPEQVRLESGLSPAGLSNALGRGSFELNLTPGAPTMAYTIELFGLSLRNEVTAIHLHFGHEPPPLSSLRRKAPIAFHPSAEGFNGPHLLNIFGLPREDDDDLMVDFERSRLSGVWDNGDEAFGPDGERGPGDSVALFEGIDPLLVDEVYVQVHTRTFPGGELRGQLRVVPEPSVLALASLGLALAARRRWRD